jgi:ElaB/YqjD/DUF883 family membrane-anchored ribosome-binding protein
MKASTTTAHSFDARVDALKNSAKHLVDVGGDRATQIKDSAAAQIDKLGSLITLHPFAAVAISFGIGYIAMRLVRR